MKTLKDGANALMQTLSQHSQPADKEALQTAAYHMARNDVQGLTSTLRNADTYIRDCILEHIDKSLWKDLGYTPLNAGLEIQAKQRLQAGELKVFKNKHFVKRDPETTNIVAVEAEEPPDTQNWVETDRSILSKPGISQLWLKTENGKNYRYFGYL